VNLGENAALVLTGRDLLHLLLGFKLQVIGSMVLRELKNNWLIDVVVM
jgi:hypothetical protein